MDREARRVMPPEDPTCGQCELPLAPTTPVTCAACSARFHPNCVSGGCAHRACALAEPSHPAWTVEERARGPWLLLPAAPRSPAFVVAVAVTALVVASLPGVERLRWAAESLASTFDEYEPWMAYSAVAGAVLVPWTALLAVALLDHALHRAVLIDPAGLLFDHSPVWRGARLSWADIAGFRLVDGGLRLVVRGRPWTRWVGPTVPCEGQVLHELVVTLEAQGVRRFDA